jgi:cobalt/nickel transport protein
MKKKWFLGLGAALAIAAFASPFASSSPDGLERVAEDKGFINKARSTINSPIPGYLLPGVKHEGLATSAGGIAGTFLTFGIIYGLGKVVVARNKKGAE